MNIYIVKGKKISEGAKSLSKELVKRSIPNTPITIKSGIYGQFDWGGLIPGVASSSIINTLIINWGDTHSLQNLKAYEIRMMQVNNRFLNLDISRYSDKKRFFQSLPSSYLHWVPKFFFNRDQAKDWLFDQPDSARLCIRHKTSSSGSNGLEIVTSEDLENDDLPTAPLYTQYIPKKHEFRAHVFGYGDTIWQQKKLKSGTENPNFQIRNHQFGWVFARGNITIPQTVKLVIEAFKELVINSWGLDFAAVDIVYNEGQDKAYVLEINSAPGLEGQTIIDYADFVIKAYEEKVTNYQHEPSIVQVQTPSPLPKPKKPKPATGAPTSVFSWTEI